MEKNLIDSFYSLLTPQEKADLKKRLEDDGKPAKTDEVSENMKNYLSQKPKPFTESEKTYLENLKNRK